MPGPYYTAAISRTLPNVVENFLGSNRSKLLGCSRSKIERKAEPSFPKTVNPGVLFPRTVLEQA